MARRGMPFVLAVLLVIPSLSTAQTTAGIGTTIVIPVTAQTGSFASEVTVFNPGPSLFTASVKFYEANNASAPGPKTCNDITVSANRSVQFHLATQCALGTSGGGQFGLLVVADKAVPATHAFYAYSRVQNPQGIGFSVEGFPVQDFNNQVSHATGLKKQAATPTYQTNCFVASLDQAMSYELRLFNDTTGAQVGGTLTGSLDAFQQFRYLDVFGPNGVNAPAGDLANIRAQFTQTSGGTANLIGFCTVQDNTSFGADFRIAKSFGSPSESFFAQGGNTFATTATLGTRDNQALNVVVNNRSALRIVPASDTSLLGFGYNPNIIGGQEGNRVSVSVNGATIAGGGGCNPAPGIGCGTASWNEVTEDFGTVAGGFGNSAGFYAAVGGGDRNRAEDRGSVGGGAGNIADGFAATVPGGLNNVASGTSSVAEGHEANALHANSFVWNSWSSGSATSFRTNMFQVHGENGLSVDYGSRRLDGGGTSWVLIGSAISGQAIATSTGGFLSSGGVWTNNSDRAQKTHIQPVNPQAILDKVVHLPVATWQYTAEDPTVRHIGPMAQDFHAAFSMGTNDVSIATIDADGVALAAIQGLHQLVQERDARIGLLESTLQAQQRALDELSQTVKTMQSRITGGM